jgi:hypothetical protein
MFGEEARSPNDSVGYVSIQDAETGLGPLGAGTGADWYIQRFGSSPSTYYYRIHHDSTVANKCPAAPPGYSSIQIIVNNQCLSYYHINGACRPLGTTAVQKSVQAASQRSTTRRGTKKKPKPTRKKKSTPRATRRKKGA